jgi:hypothetical protein
MTEAWGLQTSDIGGQSLLLMLMILILNATLCV